MVCAGGLVVSAPAQNLYLLNYGGGSVTKITPGGTQSTIATGLSSPNCLAINSAGNLFVGGQYNGIITEITPGGVKSTFATGLQNPFALAFDSTGNLFVANTGANSIIKITPQGVQSTFASGVVEPEGLAFDSAGNLYASTGLPGSGTITKFTPQGAQSTFASGLNYPVGLAIDSAGDLFAADAYGNQITEITSGGALSLFASVQSPWAIAFDSKGNLFTTVGGAPLMNIDEIAPNKSVTVFEGNAGWVSGMAFAVPEPSVFGLFGVGAATLLARRSGRQKGAGRMKKAGPRYEDENEDEQAGAVTGSAR
jgi:sugar lactone lactonase YvrE